MGTCARKEVRILLIGDRNVGKTSLILSLVSEEFPHHVPLRAEEITIPADLTPEKVPTCIVDYCAAEQSDSILEMELKRSHVICVVYAVDDEASLDSVVDHWLPLIRKSLSSHQQSIPVVLVGNKVDLVDYSTMESVLPIMSDFEEIETCVECSAKNLKNISEMFYFAQKAVLHPSGPLWNYNEKDLTDKCKRALGRIFKICDADNDGLLSDAEVLTFQRRCFGMDLEPNILETLKNIIRKNCSDGLQNGSLTMKGFFVLHGLFVQRGRHETTWTVLRKFGYSNDLSMRKDYLFPHLKVPPGSTVELSWSGHEFLLKIFEKYDQDKDKALNPQELVNVFSTCPMVPWGPEVYNMVPVCPDNGWIGLQGYLCLWTLTTLLDTSRTLEYLAYLGFGYANQEETQVGALTITRDKKVDLARKQTSRNVYRCHVIGPKDAGKTALCQGLLGRSKEDTERIPSQDLPRHTVNKLQIYGQEKYLVLEDIDLRSFGDPLTSSELSCDVYCLVYDASNPRSFEFVARVYMRHLAEDSKNIPVLIVGNKADRLVVRQDYVLQPEAFCAKYRLPPPQMFSTSKKPTKDIYTKLSTMAAFPRFQAAWMLFYDGRHLRHLGLVASDPWSLIKLSIGLSALAMGGIFFARLFRSTTAK